MNDEKVMGLEGDVCDVFEECRYSRVEGDETFDRDSKLYPPPPQYSVIDLYC